MENEPAHAAVEDASLNTWIEPTFINQYYYYDKGALLGLLLDIKIRDATNNEASLDDVMARLYREHYRRDRGFSTRDFIDYVAKYIGADAAGSFYRDYVDGREPLPYRRTLALAGMEFATDTIVEPFLGVQTASDRDGRMVVREVVESSAADRAGLRSGDELVRVGRLEIGSPDWADEFRGAYADSIGAPINLVYRRAGDEISKRVEMGSRTRYLHHLAPAQDADASQLAVRSGILDGAP